MSIRGLFNIEGLWILKSRVACHWFMSLCAFSASSKVTLHVSFALHSSAFAPVVHQLYCFLFLFSHLLSEATLVSPNHNWYKEKTEISFCCEVCKNSWPRCSESIPVLDWAVGNCQEITPVSLEGPGKKLTYCWTFLKLSVKIVSQVKGKACTGRQNTTREE